MGQEKRRKGMEEGRGGEGGRGGKGREGVTRRGRSAKGLYRDSRLPLLVIE